MAHGRVAAHKLRSALTLLGVLVGVFSIIVVMTAMRVMQSNIEAEFSQLGNQTFMVRKWPIVLFRVPEGIEKFGGGKTSPSRKATAEGRRHAGAHHRHRDVLLGRPDPDALRRPRPTCASTARPPAVFPRATGSSRTAAAHRADVDGARDCLRARRAAGHDHFPHGLGRRRAGEDRRHQLHTWSACSNPRAARWAATRTISPSCRSPPA